MQAYIIDFEPLGRRVECPGNKSLLACARELGLGISSICGSQGTCQACKVRVLSGDVSQITSSDKQVFSQEELNEGWRLACQTYPRSDCKVSVPPESMTTPQRLQVEGLEVSSKPEPAVAVYSLQLRAPTLSTPQADVDNLLTALNKQYKLKCRKVDIDVMRGLSPQLRSRDWRCQAAVRGDEVIAVNPSSGRQPGLAVDVGTTKIAAYLVDLSDGQTLAAKGIMNPQISYGEDVISRIANAVREPDKGKQMQEMVIQALNDLITELCAGVKCQAGNILDAVVVGNTVMHHLFLGLPVKQLALSPFAPAVSRALDIKSRDLGLHLSPGAYVHLLPNIAGFVGADHVAVLLATGAWQAEVPTLCIDIGTNTEVSLIKNGKIMAVSCASGPAFEGGHIKDGMRAANGAIERLRITKDAVRYQTIGDAPAAGICGSGILDAVAQLYLAGIIDSSGRMKKNHPRVRRHDNQLEFVLVGEDASASKRAIVITQSDVRELQLGKAAIRAGIQALLTSGHCREEELRQVIIAGAFGSYIDVSSAVTIGMLPAIPLERFRQVGNAAGTGARLSLISLSQRAEAEKIASKARYLELAGAPDFRQTFIEAGYLGRYRIIKGKREAIG